MALRAIVLGMGVFLASGLPAEAQQPPPPGVRQLVIQLLQCSGTLGVLPTSADREFSGQVTAYADFIGGMGDMIADNLKMGKAERAKAKADGEALLKPPHTEAEVEQSIQTCLKLAEELRKQTEAAQAPRK